MGDLGLATFPDKAALTEEHRKLGPVYYIAPEMLNEPTQADPGPADVYSLAKTLWVGATGQSYPLPGEHPLDFAPVQIGAFVVHRGSHTLDRMLARATATDPSRRPTMAEFAAELEAWTSTTTAPLAWATTNRDSLRRQFESLSSTVGERRHAYERLVEELEEEAMGLGSWLDPVETLLHDVLQPEIMRGHGRGAGDSRADDAPPVTGHRHDQATRAKTDQVTMEVRWQGKSKTVRSFLSEILDIVSGTGRRLSAVLQLQYGDLQLQDGPHGAIRWPADTDKTGRESLIPIGPGVRASIDRVIRKRPGIGQAYLFPAPGDLAKP